VKPENLQPDGRGVFRVGGCSFRHDDKRHVAETGEARVLPFKLACREELRAPSTYSLGLEVPDALRLMLNAGGKGDGVLVVTLATESGDRQ
jgi:hypothetical protein